MATETVTKDDPVQEEKELTDNDERPLIELFVKAGVDHMQNGGCPMCHRYFLLFYILREHGLIDLVVTTVRTDDVPPEVKCFSSAKQYPLVKVHRGMDSNGVSMLDLTCDTVPDIEELLDRFECDALKSVKDSGEEERAERAFADLYRKFKSFLIGPNEKSAEDPINAVLAKIDQYLKENDCTFLINDKLSRADCYLLPTLQHIRVAGSYYKDYEIPTEYEYLWRYLADAYRTDAVFQSIPADREIIVHYEDKMKAAHAKPSDRSRKSRSTLMKEARTMSVPDGISARNAVDANGDAE